MGEGRSLARSLDGALGPRLRDGTGVRRQVEPGLGIRGAADRTDWLGGREARAAAAASTSGQGGAEAVSGGVGQSGQATAAP